MLISVGDLGDVLITAGDLGYILNSDLQQVKILPLIKRVL